MPLGTDSSIFVAGHRGLVGSAIVRHLVRNGHRNILTASREELDLRNQSAVHRYFDEVRPEYVFLVAGKVGGIHANSTYPAEFLYDNMMIHANVIEASRLSAVTKLLYLGSSCIYPRDAEQPLGEDALLTGPLEPTNEAYAIAKIAGVKMCQAYRTQYGCDFIAAMPTNLYGPGDNFELENSHVLPALMRKFHDSRLEDDPAVTVWGTGSPIREFLHVDDLADACYHLLNTYSDVPHVNVGSGVELPIRELAEVVRDVVNPDASLVFDDSKPDGSPRKLLDSSRLRATGWSPNIELHDGVRDTYTWFVENNAAVRGLH